MIPIHQLLSRITWDKEFGAGNFSLGYYDRLEDRIIRVSFGAIIAGGEKHNPLEIMDSEGECHTIPLHRVREVYKNGELIWQRS